MQPFILLLLVVVIVVTVFGYTIYRSYAEKRAQEKRRNQFHDRI